MRAWWTLDAVLVILVSFGTPSSAAAAPQGEGTLLRGTAIAVSGDRIVLSANADDHHHLALLGLAVPAQCPAAGGGTWPCGVGARQALASAIEGETLECKIVDATSIPTAECFVQNRNLSLWMLETGWAMLPPSWRETSPEYDEAERAARIAGATLWYAPDTDTAGQPAADVSFPARAAQRPSSDRRWFLVRQHASQDTRAYMLVRPAASAISLDYFDLARVRGDFGAEWVPAFTAEAAGDHIDNLSRGDWLAYARASAVGDNVVPIAYVDFTKTTESQLHIGGMVDRGHDKILVLDDVEWTVHNGILQPVRLRLSEMVERRGANAIERRLVGSGLPEDTLMAGVWALEDHRIVVAEDSFGCSRWTWCKFVVLNNDGHVVLSGTAKEAPELARSRWSFNMLSDGIAWADPTELELVWEEPDGKWMFWDGLGAP